MISSRKGHAAARVINAGVLRLFFLPNPGELLKASATKQGGSFKNELHRQDPDLQRLQSGIHLDFWGTGVLPDPWSGQRARPMPELSCGTPRERRRRRRRQLVRRKPWHGWTPRVLLGHLQQLRQRGARAIPAARRQARVLQLLLRAGPAFSDPSIRLSGAPIS